MTTPRDDVLDRVAGLFDPGPPDALPAFHRHLRSRERRRRVGAGVLAAVLLGALIVVGVRASRDTTPVAAGPIELSSGTLEGTPWTLSARRNPDGGFTVGAPVSTMPIRLDVPAGGLEGVAFTDQPYGGSSYLLGVVGPEVASLTVSEGGAEIDVALIDVPFGGTGGVRAFIAPMSGAPTGWIRTRDADGIVLQMVGFEPDLTCEAGATCGDPLGAEPPILTGTADDGTTYRVVLRDGDLVMLDDSGAERGRVSGEAPGPVTVAATDVRNRRRPVVLGIASPGLSNVAAVGRFDGTGADEAVALPTAVLPDGRVAFLAYRYAGYFFPDRIVVSDASCTTTLLLAFPSLQPLEPDPGSCDGTT
jgi:hypothetical protein